MKRFIRFVKKPFRKLIQKVSKDPLRSAQTKIDFVQKQLNLLYTIRKDP